QVAGVVVVDRAPGKRAQVAGDAIGARGGGEGAGLGQRRRRKVRLEPVIEHRLTRDAQEQHALGLAGRCHYLALSQVRERANDGAVVALSLPSAARSRVIASAGVSTNSSNPRSSSAIMPWRSSAGKFTISRQ